LVVEVAPGIMVVHCSVQDGDVEVPTGATTG
jgi:hypothetical protein